MKHPAGHGRIRNGTRPRPAPIVTRSVVRRLPRRERRALLDMVGHGTGRSRGHDHRPRSASPGPAPPATIGTYRGAHRRDVGPWTSRAGHGAAAGPHARRTSNLDAIFGDPAPRQSNGPRRVASGGTIGTWRAVGATRQPRLAVGDGGGRRCTRRSYSRRCKQDAGPPATTGRRPKSSTGRSPYRSPDSQVDLHREQRCRTPCRQPRRCS